VIYAYLAADDRVVIVSIEDGRAATATVSEARK
jgi:hypothetical protein